MLLNVLQIILAVFLSTVIIVQAKGTGLGASFGGGSGYHTKRGAEKALFIATIVASILFVLTAFFNSILG